MRRHIRDQLGNRITGNDQRGQAILHILSPELSDNPKENWYSATFPKAQKVYENHGQLWLTANLLQQNGKFCMPKDARSLIEGVYSDGAVDEIPESLQGSVWDAEGAAKAEAV